MDQHRKPGFYWIKHLPDDPWIIGEWDGGNWFFFDSEGPFYNSDSMVVGKRLKSPS